MYDRENDIERMLMEENREKKRTASGVFHRASRLGYIRGGIRTQVDYLRGKEKKKYMGNGEIMESNIYDDVKNLPKLQELEVMDPEKAKHILTRAKMHNSARAIHVQLGCSNGKLYSLFDKFGVEYGKYRMAEGSFKTKDGKNGGNDMAHGLVKTREGIENVPSLDQLKDMKFEEASKIVADAKETYSLKILKKHWGVTDYMLYNHIFPKYNVYFEKKNSFADTVEETLKSKTTDPQQIIFNQTLPTNVTAMPLSYATTMQPVEKIQESSQTPFDVAKLIEEAFSKIHNEIAEMQKPKEEVKPVEEEKGYSIKVNDTYNAKAIQNRMMNILATLDENFRYKVEIKITELDEVKVINE